MEEQIQNLELRFSKSYSERIEIIEEELDKLIKGTKSINSELLYASSRFEENE